MSERVPTNVSAYPRHARDLRPRAEDSREQNRPEGRLDSRGHTDPDEPRSNADPRADGHKETVIAPRGSVAGQDIADQIADAVTAD